MMTGWTRRLVPVVAAVLLTGGLLATPRGQTPTPPANDTSWDAAVTRVELGLGYRLRRNVRLKGAWQYDWRDGGRVQREGHAAAQLAYWF